VALVSISAHDIDAAGLALEAELPLVWLAEELADAALTGAAPGRVTARLSRTGKDIIVRGKIAADLRTPCARCLEPSRVSVDTELSLLLQPAPSAHGHAHHPKAHANGKAGGEKGKAGGEKGKAGGEKGKAGGEKGKAGGEKGKAEDEYEFSTHEAEIDTYDGETVVLDPFIREAILLEVPNFPLCSEDCPGIRPAAAAPAPEAAPRVDPRLAPLGALRDKLQPAKRPSKPPPAKQRLPKKIGTATARERIPAAKAAKKKKDKE